MKPLLLIAASLLFILNVSILLGAVQPTPTFKKQPNFHAVNERVKKQWSAVLTVLNSHKITKQQAIDLRADLKSIRVKEASYIKQNPDHDLTVQQKAQLNSLLDKNAPILEVTPVPTSTPTNK
jgi:hypothetical protein